MTKKMGRPRKQIAATRSLRAREEIESRYPAAAALLELLAYEKADRVQVDARWIAAVQEIEQARTDEQGELSKNPSLAEHILHTSKRLEGLSRDRKILASLKVAVEGELGRVQADIESAKDELLQLAIQREPKDQYIEKLNQMLIAGGMTRAKARDPSPDEISLAIAALEGRVRAAPPAKAALPPKQVTSPAWHPDNVWSGFPTELEHYTLIRNDLARDPSVENRQVAKLDLPPFDHLEKFGAPHLYEKFLKETSPAKKATIAWSICQYWQRHSGKNSSTNHDPRCPPVWTFLLCVMHGFAHEVPTLKNVKFPSPWKENEVVEAKRRRVTLEDPQLSAETKS